MIDMLWPVLPAFLRARLCRRIVITGAESTGTTTLALALAEALNCPYVAEFGREYTEKRVHPDIEPWRSEELAEIARIQNEMEDAAARRSVNRWIISDTDAHTTALWHERYFGVRSSEVDAIANRQPRPFAYILTGDDIPFEADNIREGGRERALMQDHLRDMARTSGAPWMEALGSVKNRLTVSLKFLKNL